MVRNGPESGQREGLAWQTQGNLRNHTCIVQKTNMRLVLDNENRLQKIVFSDMLSVPFVLVYTCTCHGGQAFEAIPMQDKQWQD